MSSSERGISSRGSESIEEPAAWPSVRMPWVGILGPDGVGKSTLIDLISNVRLVPEASGIEVRHWRPQRLFRSTSGPVSEPHGRKARGAVRSVLMTVIALLDWWAGYYLDIVPAEKHGALVIFDRFFHDLIVDPRRYRYGGPSWLPPLLARCSPLPSLVIILDAPVHLIRGRKQELTPEEIERQRKLYRQLAHSLPNSHIIDTARPAEQVGREVAALIRDHGVAAMKSTAVHRIKSS